MLKAISNLVNMIRTVFNYCSDNPTPTAGIAAFAIAKTAVGNKLVLIDSLTQIIEGTSIGVTLDTNLIRQAMTNIAFKCGSAVAAYAGSVNNNTLRLKVDFTIPKLNKFRKDEIDDICQQIRDEANTNIAAAGAFGYIAGDVTDLQTAIDLYRTSVQNPRQAIITKKQAGVSVRLLVREIVDNLFKLQMDKMVNTLLATQADFIRGYFFAREIINLGITHAKVRGTVKDPGDVPLIGVTFAIRTTGTNDVIAQTLSVVKGKFGISPVPVGDYDLSWSFPNYQTITESNVHISAGKELQRKIILLPVGLTIIREGVVPVGTIVDVNITGIDPTPATMVIVEINGNQLTFSATQNAGGGLGPVTWTAPVGIQPAKTVFEFGTLVGIDTTHSFLKVENQGPSVGHYKITFTNLQ